VLLLESRPEGSQHPLSKHRKVQQANGRSDPVKEIAPLGWAEKAESSRKYEFPNISFDK
jgi:hypothetical protein